MMRYSKQFLTQFIQSLVANDEEIDFGAWQLNSSFAQPI